MKLSYFYKLNRSPADYNFRAELVEEGQPTRDYWSEESLHRCLHRGDYRGIHFPAIFKGFGYGGRLYDVIGTGTSTGLLLISDEMKKILEEHQLTGWQVFPVKVYAWDEEEVPGYHGWSITGKSDPIYIIDISQERGEMIFKRSRPHSDFRKYRKIAPIDNQTWRWDGSDFFLESSYERLLLTSRAAEVLKKNKVSGIYFTNLADCETRMEDSIQASHSGLLFQIKENRPKDAVLDVYEKGKCVKYHVQNSVSLCKEFAFEQYGVPLNEWNEIRNRGLADEYKRLVSSCSLNYRTMDITKFYDFCSQDLDSVFRSESLSPSTEPYGESAGNRLLWGDYGGTTLPVEFSQRKHGKLTDVLTTERGNLYLISDQMKEILEKNQLTGWKTFPVQVKRKRGKKLSGYHGLSVTGKCGPIDFKKTEIVTEDDGCPPAIEYYKGLHVGLDEWDGSDFFIPKDSLYIIVSFRAAQVLQQASLSNLSLERLSDLKFYDSR